MTKPKRIGILTSGGDCGGLNAVIRAVVRRARDYDIEIYGIKGATQGLMSSGSRAIGYEKSFRNSSLWWHDFRNCE